MPMNFIPKPGMVLMCDFEYFEPRPPEMNKKRPVVVISPRPSRRIRPQDYTGTVVPLSTAVPDPVEPFHYCMSNLLPNQGAEKKSWAKCNMLYTVSLERLGGVIDWKTPDGVPRRVNIEVTEEDLEAIRQCVRIALGMN